MLTGKILVFANLKPRPLGGVMSAGMVMCAGNEEHTKIELMKAPEDTPIGERVQLEGNPINGAPVDPLMQPILNPKRKIERVLLPLLKTNDKFEGTYFNGTRLTTSAGFITCKSLSNCGIS